MTRSKAFLLAIVALVLTGCAQPQQKPKTDVYSSYKVADPKTILILPPRNNSPNVNATHGFYSNTQGVVAESGYYVLPITLVDEHFKTNGLTVADDIHQVDPAKLREVFGADAALYITIIDYGTRFYITNSATIVTAEARLVDLRSGTQIWSGRASASGNEGQQRPSGGLFERLGQAMIKQIAETRADRSYEISKITTTRLLSAKSAGSLLPGPRSPDYKK